MSYCRKCGAKIDADARFCRICGAPVASVSTSQREPVRRASRPFILPVAILIAVLVVAFFVAVVAFVPFRSVNFSLSDSARTMPGVDTVNLNLDADVADVNVICVNLPNELVRVDVSASGTTGIFGSTTHPVQITFNNETASTTTTVTSKVSRAETWPISYNLKVTCNVYVNPTAVLNLTVRTSVGQVTMNSINAPTIFQGLNLHSTTGSVEASITDLVVVTRDISIGTTTGSVQFLWNNAQVSGNMAVNLATTTGSISANVTHDRILAGNVSLNAATTTGSVDLGMVISGNVGAQITSHTSLGSISTDMQSFNGNKSPIYSSNYPATNNFNVNLGTTTGSIHINAAYQPFEDGNQQEKVRDKAMSYLRANHPETAKFMQNLTWTGGRVDRGLIVGAELYTYLSGGWNVTMTYPVIPNPTYTITADYSAPSLGIPYRIIWEGTWQNGKVFEKSFVFAQ